MKSIEKYNIKEKIEGYKSSLVKTFKNIKSKPIDNLPNVFSILIIICGIVCSIISYIKFLIQEGYPKNIDIHKFNELFTKGTVPIFYSKFFVTIISVLITINLVLIFINYFFKTAKKGKIISLISFIVSFISIILYVIAHQIICNSNIEISQKILSSDLFWIFINTKTLPVLGIIIFISTIIFIIFLLRSDVAPLIWKNLIALVITFCGFPLIVLCMENIVLGIIAVIFLLIYVIFFMPKCKKCKGIFCLKKGETELVGKESISIKTELNNYDKNRNVVGTSETYVPGTRYTYRTEYICKKCGNKTYKYTVKDYKNT